MSKWLVIQTESAEEAPPDGLFTVGRYAHGAWQPESDHNSRDAAILRAATLNIELLGSFAARSAELRKSFENGRKPTLPELVSIGEAAVALQHDWDDYRRDF